eukprot:4650464-Amphidinium_carterae.2
MQAYALFSGHNNVEVMASGALSCMVPEPLHFLNDATTEVAVAALHFLERALPCRPKCKELPMPRT